MRVSRCGLMILVLVGLVACNRQPQLAALQTGDTVLAFGDSLTFGLGAPDAASYPAVLAQISQYPVLNAGVPGEESTAGLQRLDELLEQHDPALVIILHGGNDLLRQRDRLMIRENIASMIQLVVDHHSQVVLVAVPEPGLFPKPPDFYRELARSYQVPIELDIVSRLEADSSMKSDRVHFNQAGYRRLAEAVHQLLVDSGAL